MPDQQLQSRAGSNVGNEPAANLLFVAKAHAKSYDAPHNGTRITLWESPVGEGILRVPLSPATLLPGAIINKSAVDIYTWTLTFIDDEGNEMAVGTGAVSPAAPVDNLAFTPFDEGLFALCPGEKIVFSAVQSGTVG